MIRRWLLRIALAVGAFIVGSYATFLLLFLVTWDQGVLDFSTMAAGIALSAVTFFTTKHITHPVVEPYKPHQKRLAMAFAIAMGIAGVLVLFADQPWWQVVLLAAASAVAFWLRAFTGSPRPRPPVPR